MITIFMLVYTQSFLVIGLQQDFHDMKMHQLQKGIVCVYSDVLKGHPDATSVMPEIHAFKSYN